MATSKQKSDALNIDSFRYNSRIPYFHKAKHNSDEYKNIGYNYRGQILNKTTSPELWANPLQIPFYGQLESLITFLVEQTKMIKKTFSIAHDKDALNIS